MHGERVKSFVGIVEEWEQLDLKSVLCKIQPCSINTVQIMRNSIWSSYSAV
jgi:hypothetical protein